ncbi:hypothetical protein HOG98_08195 [bacterium]|jgi:hypothetical protein|nr:hypothetical protein [bacterium]
MDAIQSQTYFPNQKQTSIPKPQQNGTIDVPKNGDIDPFNYDSSISPYDFKFDSTNQQTPCWSTANKWTPISPNEIGIYIDQQSSTTCISANIKAEEPDDRFCIGYDLTKNTENTCLTLSRTNTYGDNFVSISAELCKNSDKKVTGSLNLYELPNGEAEQWSTIPFALFNATETETNLLNNIKDGTFCFHKTTDAHHPMAASIAINGEQKYLETRETYLSGTDMNTIALYFQPRSTADALDQSTTIGIYGQFKEPQKSNDTGLSGKYEALAIFAGVIGGLITCTVGIFCIQKVIATFQKSFRENDPPRNGRTTELTSSNRSQGRRPINYDQVSATALTAVSALEQTEASFVYNVEAVPVGPISTDLTVSNQNIDGENQV